MAISIDWATFVITIPKADMTQTQVSPVEVRQLDMAWLHDELRDIEDDEVGITEPPTHTYVAPIDIGGVELEKVVFILDPYTVTFEDGSYIVDLSGANTNLLGRTNLNSVQIRSANSVGLANLSSLEIASFLGYVSVAPSSSYDGTVFPVGTREFPVNNLTDALLIAQARGLHVIQFLEDATLSSNDFSNGYEFRGDSPVNVTLTLDSGADVTNCQFFNLTVVGTLDGNNTFRQCHLNAVNFFNGSVHECSVEGIITCGGTANVELYDSWSGVPGGGVGQTPTLQMDGSNDLILRNWSGGITLTNMDYAATASIDFNSGRVIVDSSCTDGDVTVRGVATVTDNSTGTCTVSDQTTTPAKIADAVWDEPTADHETAGTFGLRAGLIEKILRNRTVTDPVAGTITIYDDDNATVLFSASLWENVAGTTQYDGNGADRRDRLT